MASKTICMLLIVFGLAGSGTVSLAADRIDSTGPTSSSGPTNPTPPTLPTPGTGVDTDAGSGAGADSPDEPPSTGTADDRAKNSAPPSGKSTPGESDAGQPETAPN